MKARDLQGFLLGKKCVYSQTMTLEEQYKRPFHIGWNDCLEAIGEREITMDIEELAILLYSDNGQFTQWDSIPDGLKDQWRKIAQEINEALPKILKLKENQK